MRHILFVILMIVTLVANAQSDSVSRQEIKRYKSNIDAGATLFSVGLAVAPATYVYHQLYKLPQYTTRTKKAYQDAVLKRDRNTAAMAITSVAFTVTGAVFLGMGLHQRKVFKSKNTEVSLLILPGSAILTFGYNRR